MSIFKSLANFYSLVFGEKRKVYKELFSEGNYRTFEKIREVCQKLRNSQFFVPEGKSVFGKEIFGVKTGDFASENKFLVTGLIHGNEFVSGEVCLKLAEKFAENYQNQNFQVYFLPVLNPDSFVENSQKIISGKIFGRKKRSNSNGVDLNRNFPPTRKESKARTFTTKISPEFAGKFPLSEPETKILADFCEKENFKAVVNLHSFSNVLLFPGFYEPNNSKISEFANELTKAFPNEPYKAVQGAIFWRETKLKRLILQVLRGTTKICGTFDDWLYEKKIPSLLFEISAPENVYEHIFEFFFCDVALFNPEPEKLDFHTENVYKPIFTFFEKFSE
ncbi:hypothetical protein IT568_00950 [bacterium]|nr:hypothetical protein [bacterium]